MPILPIIIAPNEILSERASEIDLKKINRREIEAIADNMRMTMKKAPGVGLAAPQIGRSIRLIIVEHIPQPLRLINPQIISHSLRRSTVEEGCLSVPGKWGLIKRWRSVKVRAQNLDGSLFEIEAAGFLAQIFQHEIDHLDGILYTDRAIKLL